MTPKRFFLAGLVCAIAATTWWVLSARGAGDPLTEDALDRAGALWRENRLEDYDMEVVVSGVQQGEHSIVVRGGKVTSMTTGGQPASKSAHAYWTVDGMFRFLRDELANSARGAEAYGGGKDAEIVLRASFDSTWGYPKRFLRHVIGTRNSIEWEVTAFTPRP